MAIPVHSNKEQHFKNRLVSCIVHRVTLVTALGEHWSVITTPRREWRKDAEMYSRWEMEKSIGLNVTGLHLTGNGKYKGCSVTRVPTTYLRFVSDLNRKDKYIARAELKRRNIIKPDMELSGKALDAASLYCRDIWKKDAGKKEGLYSWCLRMAKAAYIENNQIFTGLYLYKGMKFGIITPTCEESWPVITTIIRADMKKSKIQRTRDQQKHEDSTPIIVKIYAKNRNYGLPDIIYKGKRISNETGLKLLEQDTEIDINLLHEINKEIISHN